MQYYFINRKLQSKFSDANDYVYLSAVYPEKFNGCDKIVPVKYDSHGSIEKIYEVKDVDGVLETSIIPIEYHSSFASGVAEDIKDIIEKHADFFKVFLTDFDKIVVDSSSVFSERVFTVENFTSDFSYSLNDFLVAFMDNYSVSEEYRDSLVMKILSTLEANESVSIVPNYRFYLNLGDDDERARFSCLGNLFLLEREYECLKKLLTTDSIDEAREYYIKRNCIKIINSILESSDYVPEFMSKHINLLNVAMKDFFSDSAEKMLFLRGSSYVPQRIERNSTLNLVRAILKDFDPTGKFNEVFEEGLTKKEILLLYPEEASVDRRKEISDDNSLKSRARVSIPVTGTVLDTISLVSQFMYYYVVSTKVGRKENESYIDDIVSTYYGVRTCDWLIKSGFSADEILSRWKLRKVNVVVNNYCNDTFQLMDLLYRKDKYGKISSDNIKDLGTTLPYAFVSCNEEYAISCAELLLQAPRLQCDTQLVSYSVGSYLADKFRGDDMDQKMLCVINGFADKNVMVDDMMDVITEDITDGVGEVLKDEKIQFVKSGVPLVNMSSLAINS